MMKHVPYMTICVAGVLAGLLAGVATGQTPLLGLSAVVAVWLLARWALRRRPSNAHAEASTVKARSSIGSASPRTRAKARSAPTPQLEEIDALIERLIQQGRVALLLRSQIIDNLNQPQREDVIEQLGRAMALVPEGEVLMTPPLQEGDASDEIPHGRVVHVDDVLLDRYPVTNREYSKFIECGGLGEAGLWNPKIWPGVRYFTDQRGHPGPRFWVDGTFPDELAGHPVVGVSWYEAAAYARWAGKRLPSDPEWVKAGAWPVPAAQGAPIQRKYPWGNVVDADQANLWGWGPQRTVPVTAFAAGASVGEIHQLIGNVWEWTTGNYGAWHAPGQRIESAQPLKSLRGGAFDTYFDGHSTCQFQSGDAPVARKHNIGFRCALSVCDLDDAVPIDALRDPAAALC